jgi:hypothetical protein
MAAQRGGKRPGAGRKPGSKSRATIEAKATLSELAKQYAPDALRVLSEIMRGSESDSARVAAANSLLDRGYGKPAQAMTLSGDADNPLPIVPVLNVTIGGTRPAPSPETG